jgi:diguanylate cyclase (GGDEF)-like protein
MRRNEARWGIPIPLIAVALAGGAALIAAQSHYRPRSFYTEFVPWTGLALSLVAFAIGHVSYPRIHNLKVYLGGFLCGLTSLAFFVWYLPDNEWLGLRGGFLPSIYLIIFANRRAVPLLPSFATYQATKYITWAAAGVEFVLVVLAASLTELTCLTVIYNYAWVGAVVALVAMALSWRSMQGEFYLGGVLAGVGLLYGAALCSHLGGNKALWTALEPLAACLAVLFLEVGIVFHWFVRMEHRIAYDPLLQIYNRDYCSRILSEQSKLNVAPPFTFAMVDIDHFKKVNDTYGHQTGDVVLYNVAQAVSRTVVPAGTLCRYGGEELAVFFPQKSSKQVRDIMEKARLSVERTRNNAGKKHLSVTVSCGVSTRSEPGQSLLAVLAAADKALYRAKEGGRNQVRLATAAAPPRKK